MSRNAKSELVKTLHDQVLKEAETVLPRHITPERFIRVAQTAILNSKALMECNRTSLFAALIKAAEKGLLPNGEEAALIPFKGNVQLIPMVSGLMKLIRNSGDVTSITAHVVYEYDHFEYLVNSNGESINFSPNFFEDRGKVIGAFAMANLRNGFMFDIMTLDELNKIKASSQSSGRSDSPWVKWESEMQKKTVIKRLSKRLPMSTDLDFSSINEELAAPAPSKRKRARVVAAAVVPEEPKEGKGKDFERASADASFLEQRKGKNSFMLKEEAETVIEHPGGFEGGE